MDDVAIHAEGLSKEYRLGQLRGYDTVRDAVGRVGRALTRGGAPDEEAKRVWALTDVSLDVKVGEVVGLIGRNGAGKTTFLKVLSRITSPTSGFADVNGRVGSLLEVGTGFHPELTGRENIFLNGAILGMRRREIARRFDEIVEFAGVSKFIDTPVKRYSSGMYVRLAFSVAAHMETDILLVDEVLAVGDAEFQKRCLGAMRDATRQEGRTVIFVSHNMASIKALCERVVLLQDGTVVSDGPVEKVMGQYLAGATAASSSGVIPAETGRSGSGEARFVGVELLSRDRVPLSAVALGQPLTVRAVLDVVEPIADAVLEIGISTYDGIRVCTSISTDGENEPVSLGPGRRTVDLDLDVVLLPGSYTLDLGLARAWRGMTVDFVERVLEFDALNVALDGADHYPYRERRGYVRPSGRWQVDGAAVEAGAPLGA